MSTRRRKPAPARKRTRASSSPRAEEAVERKERVLHTRVPDSLDRQIKSRARNLGLSVSTVVRHVLLNTFGLVEDIVTDSTNLALSIAGEEAGPAVNRRRVRKENTEVVDPEQIIGWQEVVLNLNSVCDRCNAVLRKGRRAMIGVRGAPGPRVLLCTSCLDNLAQE